MSKDRLTQQDQTPRDERGVSTTAAATRKGIAKTSAAVQRADSAAKVATVITDTASARRVPTGKQDRSAFLREEAARARTSTGASGKSGRRGQLKGHLSRTSISRPITRAAASAARA